MSPLDKAKLLHSTRKRLGWTQTRLAKALGLDRSYLSQLENYSQYGREIDEFYLERLALLEREQGSTPADKLPLTATGPHRAPAESACLEYFMKFLKTCRGEPARLGWTWIELRERFPLDRWRD